MPTRKLLGTEKQSSGNLEFISYNIQLKCSNISCYITHQSNAFKSQSCLSRCWCCPAGRSFPYFLEKNAFFELLHFMHSYNKKLTKSFWFRIILQLIWIKLLEYSNGIPFRKFDFLLSCSAKLLQNELVINYFLWSNIPFLCHKHGVRNTIREL